MVVASQGAALCFKESLAIEGRTGIHMTNPSLHSAEIALRSEGDIHVAVGRNTHKLDHQHTYKNRLGTRTKVDGFHRMTPGTLDIVGDVRVSCGTLHLEMPEGQYGPVLGVETRAQKRARLREEAVQNAGELSLGERSAMEARLLSGLDGHGAQELDQPGTEVALIMEKGALHTTRVKPYGTSYERKQWAPSQGLKVASSVAMAALTAVVAPVAVGAMGITNTVGVVVAKGALTASMSTLASKTLDHGGHVGKALKAMTREDGLQALGQSIVLQAGTEVGSSLVGQATAGAPWVVREGTRYGFNVGARALRDPGQALEGHLVAAAVERVGEEAAKEIGAMYRPQALKNAGLVHSGPLALEGASSAGIGYVEHKVLHALSGAAQGAVLDLRNPGQGALWGAIGAAGSEVVLESVYDPKARSEAISEEMKARMARGELAQMLAEAGVELPQLDQGEGTGSRQGVLTRSQARTQNNGGKLFDTTGVLAPLEPHLDPMNRIVLARQTSHLLPHGSRTRMSSGLLSPAQVEAGLREVFIKEMRADVERSRNLVRVGMSGVALAAGTEGAQMSTMDDRAYQALTHNAIPLVAYVSGAALEAAMPGLLAAAAGALGVTYAWDAVTGLFSASADQVAELPFNTANDKLPVKGKASQGAPAVGQSTAGGMMPEDPNDHNEEEPDDQKHHDKKIESDNFENKLPKKIKTRGAPENWDKKFDTLPKETAKLLGESKSTLNNIKGNCGARGGKPSDATTLNAAKIEKGGGQIELAKQRGIKYNHVKKVQQDQKGLNDISDALKRKLDYPKITPEEIAPVSDTLTKVKRFLKYTEKFVPKE